MANEFVVKNGLISQNNSTITGSLIVSGSTNINGNTLITGSFTVANPTGNGGITIPIVSPSNFYPTLTIATTTFEGFQSSGNLMSIANTGYLIQFGSTTGQMLLRSAGNHSLQSGASNITRLFISSSGDIGIAKSSSLNATLDIIGNQIITGSLRVTNGITGSLQGTASWANNAISSSYALTASYALTSGGGGGGVSFVGGTNVNNRIITATGTTPELNGEANLNFDGSILSVTGSVIANSFTGSLQGTASYADYSTSASYAEFSTSASSAITSSYSETSQLTNNAYFAQGILGGDQVIPSAADEIIQFVDQYDPQGWYDASTYQFTPTIAGYYTVSLGVWFENPNDNTVQLNVQMRVNGNQEMICQQPATTVTGVSLFGTKIVYLNGSTDYVDFTAYQGTTNSIKIQQGSGAGSGTWFSATYMTM
jgi:hypothetical protein